MNYSEVIRDLESLKGHDIDSNIRLILFMWLVLMEKAPHV